MQNLTDEQEMIADSLLQLAKENFESKAFTWEGETPWENIQTLADNGFLGINFDEKYGGGGLTEYEAMIMVDIIGSICPDTGYFLSSQMFSAPRTIELFGSEPAKEKYLPSVTSGEGRICIAISEPEAGSDVKSMNTEITEEGDEYLLNGEKIWVSEFPASDACVVWAKFPEGLGTVVIDLDSPGIEVANHFTNMSGHTQTQFYMENVRVPEKNIIVRGKEAFKNQLKALNWERIGATATTNAIAKCAVRKALDYSTDRKQFGQRIGDFQGIEWKLADMVKELEVSRSLMYRVASSARENRENPDPLYTTIASLYAGEMAERVVSESLQIHGANGYQQGHPLEYLHRYVRGFRIGGGTDEIHKNQIARRIKERGIDYY